MLTAETYRLSRPRHDAGAARSCTGGTLMIIRPVEQADLGEWRPLWDGYNEFYERRDKTALPEEITAITWQRFLDPDEPIFALVAEEDGQLVGLVHYLFHRSTTRIEPVCYLRDLFTLPDQRGKVSGGH